LMSVLALGGVCLGFSRGRHSVRVLADVSLEVVVGEVVSVVAQRAQGKTTLLRVAAGMVRPDRGVVCFEGEDVWGFPDRRRSRLLSREIGFVGGEAPELDVPMLENIALPLSIASGRRREARVRAMAALERVGAAECAGQLWGSLADWERALVALAHGIVREPRLLLVDDLTVSLGIEETDEITRVLAGLARERGFGVLMCVSDAGATGWSARIGSLAGGALLMAPPAPQHGTVVEFRKG
jgi:predicted ABC-type transport system involved in lysophospholipase L1 biosynthesis ATPase subunit